MSEIRETRVDARHSIDDSTTTTADLPPLLADVDADARDEPLESPDVDLDRDPFDDDLATQLDQRAPRVKATKVTLALAAALLLVAGFVAGSLSQKQWGKTPTPSNPFTGLARNGASAFPNAAASGGPGGFGGTRNSSITGTVKLVDGTTVYIVTSDGQVITVKTSGDTSVQLTSPGKLSDLTAGSTVTISGQAGTDGTVTATSISKAK